MTDDQRRKAFLPRNPKKKSKKVTYEMALEIISLAQEGHFKNRIAAVFDINPGRVAEVLKGEMFPGLKLDKN